MNSRPPFRVIYPTSERHGERADYDVDIIAVHGLGADVDKTWVWRDKSGKGRPSKDWLTDLDMLPAVLSDLRIRILTYSYETEWLKKPILNRLQLCGEDFAINLDRFRNEDRSRRRPTLFVAHSLGGLVVQHALIHAEASQELHYLPSITAGILTLGTPFRGCRMQTAASWAAWLRSPMHSQLTLITALQWEDPALLDKIQALCQLRDKYALRTCCFFEQRPSEFLSRINVRAVTAVVVPERSACIDGWPRRPLAANHYEIKKYAGPNDRSFVVVSGEIRKMCTDAVGSSHRHSTPPPASSVATTHRPPRYSETLLGDAKPPVPTPSPGKQTARFLVPFQRNEEFVGRGRVLDELVSLADPAASPDTCRRIAVKGLGGIGKTQIALEAAYRMRRKYPNSAVFWVQANNAVSFRNAYRAIGVKLRIPGIEQAEEKVEDLVMDALSNEQIGDWIILMDNMDDTGLFVKEGRMRRLDRYFPSSPRGTIVVTTRNRDVVERLAIQPKHVVSVDKMDEEEAREMLRHGMPSHLLGSSKGEKELLDLLAYLPLAVKQASAFMTRVEMNVEGYLGHYRENETQQLKLLSKGFEDQGNYGEGQQKAVATTWLLTFAHLSKRHPLASSIFQFMCFLSDKSIPRSVLPEDMGKLETDEAIGTLLGYAFIAKQEKSGLFDVHRLVRLVMRNWIKSQGNWEEWLTKGTSQFRAKFPFPVFENLYVWRDYMAHTEAATEFLEQARDKADAFHLASRIAEAHFVLGNLDVADSLYRRATKISEELWGPEHINTIVTKGSAVGGVLMIQGRLPEAEEICREALTVAERVHTYASTFRIHLTLTQVLMRSSKLEEAETRMYEMVRFLEGNRPPTDDDLLNAQKTMGNILTLVGKHREAEELLEQVVALRLKTLGADHPLTLTTQGVLAGAVANQGRGHDAERMYRHVLDVREANFGPDHIETMATAHHLTRALGQQNKTEEAEEMLQVLLERMLRIRGREHQYTASVASDLGLALLKLNRPAEAEVIFREKVIKTEERCFGANSARCLYSTHSLAKSITCQGNRARDHEAERLLRDLIVRQTGAFAPNDPECLRVSADLSYNLMSQKDMPGGASKIREAATILGDLVPRYKEVMGGEAPETADVELAWADALLWSEEQKSRNLGSEVLNQNVERRKRIFGRDHPATRHAMRTRDRLRDEFEGGGGFGRVPHRSRPPKDKASRDGGDDRRRRRSQG